MAIAIASVLRPVAGPISGETRGSAEDAIGELWAGDRILGAVRVCQAIFGQARAVVSIAVGCVALKPHARVVYRALGGPHAYAPTHGPSIPRVALAPITVEGCIVVVAQAGVPRGVGFRRVPVCWAEYTRGVAGRDLVASLSTYLTGPSIIA